MGGGRKEEEGNWKGNVEGFDSVIALSICEDERGEPKRSGNGGGGALSPWVWCGVVVRDGSSSGSQRMTNTHTRV